MMPVENKLSEMTAERLVKIVLAALDKMEDAEQIDFIAKHIDAQISLERSGVDDSAAFLDEVEEFCRNCLNKAYYSDENDIEEYFSSNDYHSSYYDDDWDYDEYFGNTEWVKIFSRLFKLSMMYIQSGDFKTGYEANTKLFSCLKEASAADCFGTENFEANDPEDYVEVDWEELFDLHYPALFQYHSNSEQAIEEAFSLWVNFGERCKNGFLTNVKDFALAERFILEGMKKYRDWGFQTQCFTLLEELYVKLSGEEFDKVSHSMPLIDINAYFYKFVMEGLCEQSRWQEAVETAFAALEQIVPQENDPYRINSKVRASIQSKLANAYENLGNYAQAFNVGKTMFQEAPAFDIYKRLRGLSKQSGDYPGLLAETELMLGGKQRITGYGSENLLRNIYSYEGEIKKMKDMALSQKISVNYYDRKYTALSLIYRAINGVGVSEIGENLAEYLTSANGQDGIADMIISDIDTERRMELLLYGTDLLKEIIAFHIDAASRTRYAKAANYMCVLRDIFEYLAKKDEFMAYFENVIAQNSRRPALRDEMNIVCGRKRGRS